MAWFLLVLIVVGAMTVVSVATVVGSQFVVRHDQQFTQAMPPADGGVQQALYLLNNQTPPQSLPSCTSPRTETVNGVTSTWCTTVTDATHVTVTATGTDGKVTRHVTADLVQDVRFAHAAFADNQVTFNGGNSADSYDYASQQRNTGHGTVGTNGSLTFRGNATANGAELYNWGANPNGSRCSGGPCDSKQTVDNTLDISSSAATAFITSQLSAPPCGSTLASWKASDHKVSDHNAILSPGVQCYSSVEFDVDTTVAGNASNPTILYVSGNVTVGNNVDVNISASGLPDARALLIYSLGSSVSIGNHANVAAAIWAPLADCGGNPSNAQADIYGAAVCKAIGNQGGWNFHYDDALSSLGSGVWRQLHYAEQ